MSCGQAEQPFGRGLKEKNHQIHTDYSSLVRFDRAARFYPDYEKWVRQNL